MFDTAQYCNGHGYIDPLVQFGVAHGTAGQSPVQFQSALSKRPARSSDTPRAALALISVLQNLCVYYVYSTHIPGVVIS